MRRKSGSNNSRARDQTVTFNSAEWAKTISAMQRLARFKHKESNHTGNAIIQNSEHTVANGR